MATCADVIMAMLKWPCYAETAESRQTLRAPSFAAYVRVALRNDESNEKLIKVTVLNGRAELTGITDVSASAWTASSVAAATSGITGVTNTF